MALHPWSELEADIEESVRLFRLSSRTKKGNEIFWEREMKNRKEIFEELKKVWDAAKETKEAVSVHMFFNPMNNKHIICINDDRYEFVEKK